MFCSGESSTLYDDVFSRVSASGHVTDSLISILWTLVPVQKRSCPLGTLWMIVGFRKLKTNLTGRGVSQFMGDGRRTIVNRPGQMEEKARLRSMLRYPDLIMSPPPLVRGG